MTEISGSVITIVNIELNRSRFWPRIEDQTDVRNGAKWPINMQKDDSWGKVMMTLDARFISPFFPLSLLLSPSLSVTHIHKHTFRSTYLLKCSCRKFVSNFGCFSTEYYVLFFISGLLSPWLLVSPTHSSLSLSVSRFVSLSWPQSSDPCIPC